MQQLLMPALAACLLAAVCQRHRRRKQQLESTACSPTSNYGPCHGQVLDSITPACTYCLQESLLLALWSEWMKPVMLAQPSSTHRYQLGDISTGWMGKY